MPQKFLIIRFSAFGDVTQSLSVPTAIVKKYPEAEVHFLTRKDMSVLLESHPNINKIWSFDRKSSLLTLVKLALEMRKENFNFVYDAHNNLRSRIVSFFVRKFSANFIRRSIRRWKRFLLFKFRINKFEQPFSGQRDLLEPLEKWGISKQAPPAPQLFLSSTNIEKAKDLTQIFSQDGFVALAPSAAHFLKRWPKNYWIDLIQLRAQDKFVLLGGPEDIFFRDIASVAPDRVLNLAGKCNLAESAAVVSLSKYLIANDTGLLHVAEQLGKECIAFMGPAPFGFPSRPSTKIMQLDLSCRPCSKHGQGPCINSTYQKCLVDIKPLEIAQICASWSQK